MPKGKKFTTGKVDETLEALNKVTPKPKTAINLKELIRGLKPKIKRLRNWGYEWHEIVELLKQQEIEIASDTLKEYLKTPRRKKDKLATKEPLSPDSSNSRKSKQIRDTHEELKPVRTDKLNKDDKALTTSTEAESEPGSYQPIKLTMRK